MPSDKRPLKPHQIEASKFIRRLNGQAGIFMAPGTGKTLVAIRYAALYLPALVLCRRDDILTWLTELENEGVKPGRILVIDSTESAQQSWRDHNTMADWTICTHDLVKSQFVYQLINASPWATVIVDESHTIKRWGSDRTQAILSATRHIPRRLALTGSPITNDPLDVFSQGFFIDNGKTFGVKEWDFLNRYYLKSGPGWYIRKGAKETISKLLSKIGMHVHEDDVLKLPPIREVMKAAPMSTEQEKVYNQVLDEWEYQIEQGTEPIEINHVTVQLAKLRQIAGGFLYHPNGKEPVRLPCPKLEMLKSMLDDPEALGRKKKIVVWAAHTDEIRRIAEEVKYKSVTFFGSDRKQKEAARKSFRDDPTIRLFIGQVDAGVGMNELVVADTAVYYSNSFKAVSRQQSTRRIRRIGSEHHRVITYWDLVTEGSVDPLVLASVQSCMDVATVILEKLKRGQKVSKVLKRAG